MSGDQYKVNVSQCKIMRKTEKIKMKTVIKAINGVDCAIIYSDIVVISDIQSALDFIMTVKYETGCDRIAINKEAIDRDFFILSTGLAGEILQKFVNYRTKFAMFGDFSIYTSKPLKDFIYECNRGREVFFAATEEEAAEKLGNA